MTERYSTAEKDLMLQDAFAKLKARGISSSWSAAARPYTALRAECRGLMGDAPFRRALADYLRVHTTLPRSVEMLFTCIAMAARAQWHDAPDEIKPVVARGWFLGRWLPTFLIIDGPIGRFMTGDESPLRTRYGTQLPALSSARDFLTDRTFRLVRNGFAHWGFDWEVVGEDSYVVAYDWERDLPVAKLHQSEADAYHIISFALLEILDDVMLRPARSGSMISRPLEILAPDS